MYRCTPRRFVQGKSSEIIYQLGCCHASPISCFRVRPNMESNYGRVGKILLKSICYKRRSEMSEDARNVCNTVPKIYQELKRTILHIVWPFAVAGLLLVACDKGNVSVPQDSSGGVSYDERDWDWNKRTDRDFRDSEEYFLGFCRISEFTEQILASDVTVLANKGPTAEMLAGLELLHYRTANIRAQENPPVPKKQVTLGDYSLSYG